MTSKIVVNNIESDSGISSVTFTSDIELGTKNLKGHNLESTGIVTAVSFTGSGANLTNLPSQVTINNALGNRVITSDGGTTLNCEDTLRYDGTNFLIGTNTEAPYNNRNLTVAAGGSGSTTVAIEIRSPSNGTGRVIFSDGTSADSSANEGQVIYQQSDHKMLFGVAANYQNMALESTGGTGADLNLIDGNLKFASGHGIDFSANSNAGGMTNELLDDYERGTWTPTLNVTATYTTQLGVYVKIGKLVYVEWALAFNSLSGTGYPYLQGLPFHIYANNGSAVPNIRAQDAQDINLRLRPHTSYGYNDRIYVRGYDSSGNAYQPAGITFWNNGNFNGNMTYMTT